MNTQILDGFSAAEKTAYVTAIASIATADQSASELELNYLQNLAQVAGLSDADTARVVTAATETNGESLKPALDSLKNSELKYSLVTDLMAFAQADNEVVDQEKTHIQTIASYLNISSEQMEALNEYVQHTTQQAVATPLSGQSAAGGLDGLLSGSGLGEKLQNSGINIGSLAKGLLSFVGPMIMGNLLNKGLQSPNATGKLPGGGGLGDLLGGLTGGSGSGGGGLGDLLGGLSGRGGSGQGGLGGLLGGLSGGKGIGGLLSGFLK